MDHTMPLSALGAQPSSKPDAGFTAANRTRAFPFTDPNLPPMYTVVDVALIAPTVPLTLGRKSVSNAPVTVLKETT